MEGSWEDKGHILGSGDNLVLLQVTYPPFFTILYPLSLPPCFLSCNHSDIDPPEGILQCKHLLGNINKLPKIALATWIIVTVLRNKSEACLLLKVFAYTVQIFPWNASHVPGKWSLPLCLSGDWRRDMAERHLITIPAQSKSNWIPPRDLFVVCYFERLCTAPVLASLKPGWCRAGQRKPGGSLGKSTRAHSQTDTIHWEEATVRRKRCFRSFCIFTTKEKCITGNKFFSPDHFRSFWNLRSGNAGLWGCKGLSLFYPSFPLNTLKIPTQLHMLALTLQGACTPVVHQEDRKESHLHSS